MLIKISIPVFLGIYLANQAVPADHVCAEHEGVGLRVAALYLLQRAQHGHLLTVT